MRSFGKAILILACLSLATAGVLAALRQYVLPGTETETVFGISAGGARPSPDEPAGSTDPAHAGARNPRILRGGHDTSGGAASQVAADECLGRWRAAFQTGDPRARKDALREMSDLLDDPGLTPDAVREVLSLLLLALRDDDADVSFLAAVVLGNHASIARPILQDLSGEIGSERWNGRKLLLLEIFKEFGTENVPYFRRMIEDPDPKVRDAAFGALLDNLNPQNPEHRTFMIENLVGFLRDPSWAAWKRYILSAIAEVGADAYPFLLRCMSDADAELRAGAVEALGDSIGSSLKAFDGLTDEEHEETGDEWEQVIAVEKRKQAERRVALMNLLQGRFETMMRTVAGLLDDPDGNVQTAARDNLTVFREDAGPVLVEFLRSGIESRQLAALATIRDCEFWGRRCEDILYPCLIEAVRSTNPRLRSPAVQALRSFPSPSAIPEFQRLLGDPDARVAAEAASALAGQGDDGVPAIRESLAGQDPLRRRNAALAVSMMGERAAAFNDELAALLADPDALVREYAVIAVGGMGQSGTRWIPRLSELTRDPEKRIRVHASAALLIQRGGGESDIQVVAGDLGLLSPSWRIKVVSSFRNRDWSLRYKSPALVPLLVWMLRNNSDGEELRDTAAMLGDLGPHAAAAVPELLDALPKCRYHARDELIRAIGRIGPPARAAIPALEAIAVERNDFECVRALKGIGPEAIPALENVYAKGTGDDFKTYVWKTLAEMKQEKR